VSPPDQDILYTLDEAAGILKVAKYTLYKMRMRGDIPSVKLGSPSQDGTGRQIVRIRKSDIDDYIAKGVANGNAR